VIPLKDDNPSRSFPAVTIALIALNVLVFLADLSVHGNLSKIYAMRPARVTHYPTDTLGQGGLPVWGTLLTMMFLHGGWMHLGGNMLFLWIFGNNTEDTLGHFRFLLFYLVCGLAASGLQILFTPNSSVPTVGASGAIAGVLGAYYYLFPDSRVTTLIFIVIFVTVIEIPARVVLGLWFLMNLYNTLLSAATTLNHADQAGGVAFAAHVGGFVAGLLLIRLMARRPPPRFPTHERPRFFDDNWR
jgi:membrane associated rhomboid family serine protease